MSLDNFDEMLDKQKRLDKEKERALAEKKSQEKSVFDTGRDELVQFLESLCFPNRSAYVVKQIQDLGFCHLDDLLEVSREELVAHGIKLGHAIRITRGLSVRRSPDLNCDSHFMYFAYGSNLSSERIHQNSPSARFICVASVEDYQLKFTRTSMRWGAGVADIREAKGSTVWGVVWQIDTKHSHHLDRQEGVPVAYKRISVTAKLCDGRTLLCRSYQVAIPQGDHIAPSQEYMKVIKTGSEEFKLPKQHMDKLDTYPLSQTVEKGADTA